MFIIVITCPHLSTYVIITRYELNCKRPEVALSYLDLAVRIDPEETLVGDEEEENRGGG